MSSSEELAASIQWLLRRYRGRLVTRTGLVGLLSLGCISALVWRLWLADCSPAVLVGSGLVGLLVLGAWQWLTWRRQRLSSGAVALDVDRMLNLQARLITATELAHEPNPPALYPVLLQETREALSAASAKLPRVIDRRVAGLSAALLLLLLWRSHPAASLTQLATLNQPQPPPEQPPPEPPPQPPEQQEASTQSSQDQQQSQQQQQQGSSSQQQSSQGADQSQPSPSSSAQSSTTSRDRQSQGSQQTQRASDQQEGGQRGDQTTSSPRDGSQQDQQRADGSSERREADQGQVASRQKPSPDSSDHQEKSNQQRGASQSAASSKGAQPQSGEGSSSKDQLAQEALKGDIQQLLKQLSEELQSLQAHIDEQRVERPHPAPGTSTDPQLYDDADVSAHADPSQRRLPIQMAVDQQAVAARRPAGGVGKPSDDIATQTPQQLEEEAQLASQATDAKAVTRDAIPPEYQPVFDRLSSQPKETTSP